MTPKITVVNKHHKQTGEYIGRGSPLGNPFPITPNCTRHQAITNYKVWLDNRITMNDPAVCNELNRLAELAQQGELKLQCFCKPLPCHGDVIKQVLLDALK